MSLSDCSKCWDTPCTCGWGYRFMDIAARIELAAVILGVSKKEIEKIPIPYFHPIKEENKDE